MFRLARLAAAVFVLSLVLMPVVAFAQDIPEPPSVPVAQAPSVGLQLGGALLDLLMAALVAGIGLLAAYLRTKAAESRAANVGLIVTEAARSAVLDLDRELKPKLQAALADGVLTDKEKGELKEAALVLLKTKLPSGLLGTAASIFGAFTDTYLAGKIEQAVKEKNAMDAAATSPRSP